MVAPLLAALAAQGDPIRDIAQRHELSYRQAYLAVRSLEQEGLVQVRRQGKQARVQAATETLAALAASLLYREHPAWPQVFQTKRIPLLHAINRLQDIPLAAKVAGYARQTAYQIAKELAPKGVLLYKTGAYRFHPGHRDLRDLVEEWMRVRAQHACTKLHPEARVVYCVGREVLFQAPSGVDDALPAGLTAFQLHGVLILTGDRSDYALSPRDQGPADHLCQALRIEPDNPIIRSYAALVWELKEPDLDEAARIYGVVEEAKAVQKYASTRQDQDGFLPWKEHQRYRRMYVTP